jgi:hypothetical protein
MFESMISTVAQNESEVGVITKYLFQNKPYGVSKVKSSI